ncbi:MAG: ABC transporter permease [Streptococcaceae bacterium]|jgi:ABC-2 type transport system permease protein|nr:ABC transporter permease [Streptococcaceae bacterium]
MDFFEKKNRILLIELTKTDFKLRYQGSFVGYLWSILKPIMLFLVMYIVFIKFLRFGNDVPHFAVSLLLGITVWNFFGESTGIGMTSIVARGDLLRKVSFPKSIIVLSVVTNALINLAISTVVVAIFALINGVTISWTVIFVPFLFVELVLFTLGVTFILSTIYVYFRDIAPVWEVILQAGFYATPIIYPITYVSKMSPAAAKLVMLSPMAQIVQDLRYILTFSNNTNPTIWQLVHNPLIIAVPYLLSIFLFVFGWWIFSRRAAKFAEVV